MQRIWLVSIFVWGVSCGTLWAQEAAPAAAPVSPTAPENLQALIRQESEAAVDRYYAPDPDEVRQTAEQARDTATSQPAAVRHFPFRDREAAQEARAAELAEIRKAYADQINDNYRRFTDTRNRPLPTKGRRGDYTAFNQQFQEIKRRN
jgi:membrane protein involved in colicin uptake